jgi:putative ABC transport system permease protein
MLQDLRHAARSLRHAGALPIVAVLTLAIGIGGVSAMFSVVNRLVLDPLPFRDGDRLVLVWGSKPQDGQPEIPFSQPDFEDLRQQARTLDAVGGWALGRGNVTGTAEPEQVQWAVVTANLFGMLGVTPQLGRSFDASEDRPGAAPVAIITHALWQRRFGGAPDVLDRTVILDNRALQVVGVLQPDFSFLTFPSATDVWMPLGADPSQGRRFTRGGRSMGVLGRLRSGKTLADARAEGDAIAAALASAHPFFNTGRRISIVPLREQVAREARGTGYALFGAVVCVLLIACANVSSLMLARAAGRQRDFLIRSALGASRWRLVRHQLAESLLISIAGGGAGLLLSVWLIELLASFPYRTDSLFVPFAVARDTLGIDAAALAFTMLVTMGSALVFSLGPALRHWAPRQPAMLVASAGATADRPQRRFRAVLVAGEVALAVVLLASAGLMLKSTALLQRVDPGFSSAGVLSLQMTLSRSSYSTPARRAAFYGEALERLHLLPGVTGAAAAEYLPFSGIDGRTGFFIDGRPEPARADQQQTHYRSVSAGYFDVMGMRIAAGRGFTTDDRPGGARVAVINETMARTFWPGENPLGRRIALDFETMRFFSDRPPTLNIPEGMRVIVGIVSDIRHNSLQSAAQPEMYVPFTQKPVADMTIVLRSDGDPLALATPARDVIRAIDALQPVAHIEAISNLVSRSTAQSRASSWMLSGFAAVALTLAMIGVFGLLAHDVALRTRELGIRLALGGRPRDVRWLVLKNGLQLVAAGLLAGLPIAVAAGRWLATVLFQVSATDPLTMGGAVAAVVLVSVVACAIPARRATGIDPTLALRAE